MIPEAIQQYISEGISVFPVPYKSKKAIDKWKEYQTRIATNEEVKTWFNGHPSNIAVICGSISGNLVVLDCDSHERYAELTMKICDKLGITDVKDFTRVSQTAKGFHIWLRTKEPVKSQKFPALDIKGEGGYIIAPPSKHPSEAEYKMLNNLPIAIIDDLLSIGINIDQPKRDETINHPEWVSQLLSQGAPEGMRNDKTASLAGYFRDRLPIDVTQSMLLLWNYKNTPPLPDDEIIRTIGSIYQKPVNPLNGVSTRTRGVGRGTGAYTLISSQQDNIDRDKNVSENVTNSGTKGGERVTLSQAVRDWIEGTNGWWAVEELDKDLELPKGDKANRRKILQRLRDEGFIEQSKKQNKLYRRIIRNLRKIDFKNVNNKTPLSITLPFNLHRLVNIYPGNIIVVAGSPDAGKTAWLLNIVRANMDKFGVYYFSSEMGELELVNRLSKFEGVDDWNFEAEECASNFADVIRPDCINIIDYMELNEEVYRVAEYLKDIHDKLGSGIAIVAIQKKIGASLGRGAEFSLEKPRLYLSMDTGITIIQKAKNWSRSDTNPNKLQIKYKIVNGCKFVIDQEGWHYSDRLAPEWVASLNRLTQGYTTKQIW